MAMALSIFFPWDVILRQPLSYKRKTPSGPWPQNILPVHKVFRQYPQSDAAPRSTTLKVFCQRLQVVELNALRNLEPEASAKRHSCSVRLAPKPFTRWSNRAGF